MAQFLQSATKPENPHEYLLAHVDGGARGNPGPAGYGVVIEDHQGKPIAEFSRYLGHRTNNFAEYSGLIAALNYVLEHGHSALRVLSDSELMVRQMNGVYKVRSPELRPLYEEARRLARQLKWFRIEHVRREKNAEADRLANEAMDRKT
jgi:ribonuclease HI